MDLTKWNNKKILTAAGLVILLVTVYFLVRKVIRSINSDSYNKKVANEIDENALTYPLSQYITWADQLDNAMNTIGTDENAIYSIFAKLNNLSDVLQLIKAFGTRDYYLWGNSKNLPQWIAEELNNGETAKVNSLLKNKNINFSF